MPSFDNIQLTDECLSDPLLMALAWKKAHNYIRTTSWYADNFELDKTSLDLPDYCEQWAKWIKNGRNKKDIKLNPLELVPAPKSSEWTFKTPGEDDTSTYCLDWKPKNADDLRLRPLAHVGIREQTLFTLLMMCLANHVETKQGDPATENKAVHEKRVVSYGNRLFCTYEDDKAEHNYGATYIYSKFFLDYRKFLQRPYHFANKALSEKHPDDDLYIVELDIKQFFDRVDRNTLKDNIVALVEEQGIENSDATLYTKLLDGLLNWEWDQQAKADYTVCTTVEVPEPPMGIPQGLVAGGFLANIYLLAFDDELKAGIGQPLVQPLGFAHALQLVDYCRYVDDMRLVLTGPKLSHDCTKENLQSAIEDYWP